MKSPITTVEVKTIRTGVFVNCDWAEIYITHVSNDDKSVDFALTENGNSWSISKQGAKEIANFFNEISKVLKDG